MKQKSNNLQLDEEDIELIKFISTVVRDGRYITDLATNPSGVANKLDCKLSNKSNLKLINLNIPEIAKITSGGGDAKVALAIAIVISIQIAIIVLPRDAAIIDNSNRIKL